MKKYVYLTMVIIMISIFSINNKSYAFNECKKEYSNLNTINIFEKINPNEKIISICSFEDCYNLKNESIKVAINNFQKLLRKNKSEDYKIDIEVKGIPITSITFESCK